MRVKTWKILDRGQVPAGASEVEFACPCGYEAMLPVMGRPLAQCWSGIVFDNDGPFAMPTTVQCRKCRRILTNEPEDTPNVR